ncbi:hypothetical protein Tco_0391549, partial [Tanacetum coccineum]
MEIGAPEVRHRLPVSSKDSNKTDILHLGPGRGRRVVCWEEKNSVQRNALTPRIRHFNFPRTRMSGHVKTYDGSGDPEDHLKLFQAAAKTE